MDWKSADDLINWYTWIIDNYPVVSIEDGLAENEDFHEDSFRARPFRRAAQFMDKMTESNREAVEISTSPRAPRRF